MEQLLSNLALGFGTAHHAVQRGMQTQLRQQRAAQFEGGAARGLDRLAEQLSQLGDQGLGRRRAG